MSFTSRKLAVEIDDNVARLTVASGITTDRKSNHAKQINANHLK